MSSVFPLIVCLLLVHLGCILMIRVLIFLTTVLSLFFVLGICSHFFNLLWGLRVMFSDRFNRLSQNEYWAGFFTIFTSLLALAFQIICSFSCLHFQLALCLVVTVFQLVFMDFCFPITLFLVIYSIQYLDQVS